MTADDLSRPSRPLVGVWAPVLTPFRDDLSIDYDRFGAFCCELLASGCHGLALLGTTSETASLSVDERRRVLEAALAAGVPPDRIVCGTGACALPDAVELTRHACAVGCPRVLVVPPWYFKDIGDEGCLRALTAVIDRTDRPELRVALYNIPSLSGVAITPAVVTALVERFGETVIGIKDSSGDPMTTLRFIKAFRGLAVATGSEAHLLPALKAGGAGCVTATANVEAAPIRALYDGFAADDARARQAAIAARRTELEQDVDIIVAMKRLLAERTGHAAWAHVRPPLG